MSMRQFANRNRGVITASVILLLLICGWVIFRQTRAMFSSGIPGGAYYTTDDGKSWFSDDFNKITPFVVGGKEAVEAHVFTCNGEQFVAYMTRYNAQAKQAIEDFDAARAAGKTIDGDLAKKRAFASMSGKEYKRPGDSKWVPQGQAADMAKLTSPKCSDNSLAVEQRL